MRRLSGWHWCWALSGGAGLLLGCASILGIEEAVCDPKVDPQCGPAAADNDVSEDDDDDVPEDDDVPDDDGDDDIPADDLCGEYCAKVMEACPSGSGLEQYNSATACHTICQQSLEEGEPGELGVDTLQCRLTLAQSALDFGERADCANAGFSGNGQCGEICEVYCSFMVAQCNDFFTSEFGNFDSCMEHCAAVPRSANGFDFSIDEGNTLECRFWHLQATFGAAGPRVHCPHATGLAICR